MVPLLQVFSVHALVGSYVAFVLSLFVPHLSFFWCLGKAVLGDCGISRVSSLEFMLFSFVTKMSFLMVKLNRGSLYVPSHY